MPSADRPLTVGVVGAGQIGRGVAHGLAEHGHRVVLVDVTEDLLATAMTLIRREMRAYRLLGGGGTVAAAEALAAIEPTADYDRLAAVDFVVENVVESRDIKRKVYQRLDHLCPQSTVFAANTSAITVADIGGFTERPDRVLGLHFMNPVPLKEAVEVIAGPGTSRDTLATATGLLKSMGKRGIVVGDSPGFVSNRVLMLAVNEAAHLVQEGVADAAGVDAVFTDCLGHRMGVLATADLIGIDTVLLSIEMLHEQFGGERYRPCSLLRAMVEAGHLGRKSGRGFHEYPN